MTTRFVLLALCTLIACADPANRETHGDEPNSSPATVEHMARFGVTVGTAAAGTVDRGLQLAGEVRPNADRLGHLAPRFAGVAREVRKAVGDPVRAGEVLARIESEHLSTYALTAAFDGTVIDRHVTLGETVGPERAAFIVADLSTVWIELAVHQQGLPQVRVGQTVHVAASHGPEADGVVSYVAPVVDQATRMATARVVLPNADGAWRPGTFVDASVRDDVPARVVVPRAAVQRVDGAPVVFVVDDEHFVARPVRLGQSGRTRVEIVDGLAAGDRFAEQNAFLVRAEAGKGDAGHED